MGRGCGEGGEGGLNLLPMTRRSLLISTPDFGLGMRKVNEIGAGRVRGRELDCE